jgi:hypothetical protein
MNNGGGVILQGVSIAPEDLPRLPMLLQIMEEFGTSDNIVALPEGMNIRAVVEFLRHDGPPEEFVLSADDAEAETQRRTLDWLGVDGALKMRTPKQLNQELRKLREEHQELRKQHHALGRVLGYVFEALHGL